MSVETKIRQVPPKEALEQFKEKKEPSLGELNPLLFPPNLENPEAIAALTIVTTKKITQYGGLHPTTLEPAKVYNVNTTKEEPRFIARFEVDTISEEELGLLEALIKKTYGASVRTRHNSQGYAIPVGKYPELESKDQKAKKQERGGTLLGWYFGPNLAEIANTHAGLFIYKNLGSTNMANFLKGRSYKDWFFSNDIVDPITKKPVKTKTVIEIREGNLYQTDLVELITQVSSTLANKQLIDNPWLKYEIYNDLNRLGLKRTGKDNIYGLDEQIKHTERVLILLLANPYLSRGIDLKASSVLLVGVPGTGKTLVAEYFLQKDIGVFLVPIDPLHLSQELSAPPEKKTILPRISQVSAQTGIPIVLHIDDIENIMQGKEQNAINSTILNLMAGVRESGFFVLASTNHPEQLNEQLLQPQRFAHILYFGLCNEEARRGILEIHATRVSRELEKPLFSSIQERDLVLTAIARNTQNYTPRYLAEICTIAKTFYLQRVASTQQRNIGLTENNINSQFSLEDWAKAMAEVDAKYKKGDVEKRDGELRAFVEKHQTLVGFTQNGQLTDTLEQTIKQLIAEGRIENFSS